MNAGLTLESTAKMRAQHLHSAFPYHRPTSCLLELFASIKCSTDLTTLDSVW